MRLSSGPLLSFCTLLKVSFVHYYELLLTSVSFIVGGVIILTSLFNVDSCFRNILCELFGRIMRIRKVRW